MPLAYLSPGVSGDCCQRGLIAAEIAERFGVAFTALSRLGVRRASP